MTERLRFLPLSVGLGLLVGDLATLAFRGELSVRRVALSGLVAVVAYYVAAWWVSRRLDTGDPDAGKPDETDAA